jgi:bacteriocin biosynthesis cyclodehydratase domain-containing protein
VRPALKSGLLPVWRDRDTLQIGIDPRRAVALTGMSQAGCIIGLLDGSRDRCQVVAAAAERGIPAQTADRVIALLAAGGALDDFPASTLRAIPQHERARLAPELAAASLASGDGDGGARSLARRHAARVHIYGAGRIGPAIASILVTSGVGLVTAADSDAQGRSAGDAGDTRPARADSRREPTRRERTGRAGARPAVSVPADLAIVTGHQAPELPLSLMKDRVPHLAASATEAIGVVGPLVRPGRTACLRCLDYTRADNDPAWPLILAQLARRQPDPAACDAALVAAVAAQAAAQALAFLDQAPLADAVTNGTLELVLPAWQWRRRTWRSHEGCACGSSTVR